MFYISAAMATLGAVGYQFFIKLVPPTANPLVSILGLYLAALILGLALLLIFPVEGSLILHFRQLNWIQFAIAASVMLVNFGYLWMFRSGWDLSTAGLVTGVFINIILVALGVFFFAEQISLINAVGIFFCILGVALINYNPS
jgi:drug/metabolite transporter (DMT)-like permease